MEDYSLVIMEKNAAGKFVRELGMYKLEKGGELIAGAFAAEEGGIYKIHISLCALKELSDDEFSACYDYYETDAFSELGVDVLEAEDCHYPTWIFSFPMDNAKAGDLINEIIRLHMLELDGVYSLLEESWGAGKERS